MSDDFQFGSQIRKGGSLGTAKISPLFLTAAGGRASASPVDGVPGEV